MSEAEEGAEPAVTPAASEHAAAMPAEAAEEEAALKSDGVLEKGDDPSGTPEATGGEGGEAGNQGQLIAAVNKGDEEVVGKMLDERRAEVDMMDSGGATPLMLACHQGNPQLGTYVDDHARTC